ncbi:hypothetical protein D915_008825 [Fasciola hepatica]|uniref:Platelet-derived growth factor (PDGF) family profile domain-containing protein n=1 Tax=Fasciola hepatica TaxID=6192 RepID=A0A4E0QZ01_FASHE|nr:hypothetical protein D915_008825 [Fasciola hepatica]
MISQNRTDFGQHGSRIKFTTVGSLIYSYLIVYTLTRMQITGHVLHLVRDTTVQTPNTDSAQTVSIPYANTIARDDGIAAVSKSLSRRRIANITSNITTSKPTTTVHVPFVSQWYTAYSDKGTTTTRTASSSGTRNIAEVNKQKQPNSRRSARRDRSEITSGPQKSHSSIGSWLSSSLRRNDNVRLNESPFVINSSDMHSSIASFGLPDLIRTGVDSSESARLPPLHMTQLNDDDLHSAGGWCTRNLDKDKEISRFVIFLLSRYTVSINPLQIYSIVHEWERYQHQRQVVLQRQWMQVLRQQKRRQRRLEEYNRHLRHFASVLTQQHLNQLRKARTFREFKEIMFDSNTLTTNTIDSDEDHSISSPEDNASHSLIESPLPYPVSGHTIVAAASSALEFPGGAGGGIIVSSLRSSRKGSTRESRAIMEPPISISTEHLVTVSAKSKQMEPTQTSSNQRDDSVHHMSTGDEKSRYSEVELRSAFESYQEFRRTACQPRNQTLCVRALLGLQQEHTTVVIPSGFYVRRCGTQIQPVCSYHALPVPTEIGNENPNLDGMADGTSSDGLNHIDAVGSEGNLRTHWYGYTQTGSIRDIEPLEYTIDRGRYSSCECETAEEECLPTNVTLRTQAVAKSRVMPLHNLKHSTELISVTEHTSCGCQPRCKNRLCISPLKLVIHTFSDCACVCPPRDTRCRQLLEGIGQFTPKEIPLPLNGSYILPPCQYGPMDDVHLYHRRCPQPIRRSVGESE